MPNRQGGGVEVYHYPISLQPALVLLY